MNDLNKIQEQHTAAPSSVGFDYQFLYFMCLVVELKTGEKVGFEVKDDVHIERADKTITLFQCKHSINQTNNLTTLDIDLWKTVSNWAEMIKAEKTILTNHTFCLVTNKGEGNNKFIDALTTFKSDSDIDKLIETIKELRDKTTNADVKSYIKDVLKLSKKNSKIFFSKLSIETNIDNIIGKTKTKIYEKILNDNLVDDVFEKLHSNLITTKYFDVKNRKNFEISFNEFSKKYGKCFRVAYENKPLPKRKFQIILPENLEAQIFIKQLIDIGELNKSSNKIYDYTAQMLQAMNQLSYWADNDFLLPTEMDEFEHNAIFIWDREFRAKYRQVERKIKSGTPCSDLEDEIKPLALELIDAMRRENLPVAGEPFGVELSNGHYYSMSDKPQIGWHFEWEKKYKTS